MSEPTSIAHYRIVSKLGEGGMGAVYRATDTKLNRDIAIKVLPTAFAEDAARMARFEREAQMLAALNHPNIAAIYGIEQGAIVMELVEGADLRGPVPVETAIRYARQIAVALEAAHEKGIIHRDLKPANIKVTPDGTVKLLDFGLAKSAEPTAPTPTGVSPPMSPTMSPTLSLAMTQMGVILGTAAYMSPEQARGLPVDRRADIWSFGVVLFELLSGKMVFGGGETVSDSLAAVIAKEPDWSTLPPDTPPHVRRLLERCLCKDPKQRLQAIGEARILLDSPEPEAPAPQPATPVASSNARWWMVLAAVLALALAAVSAIHFRETPPEKQLLTYSLAPPPKTTVQSFALSPNGRYLAMAVSGEEGAQLWVRALDSLEPQLMKSTEDASYPFWSPDSRNIAFFAQGKLKRIAADGGPVLALCDAPAGRGGAWNREGVILFAPSNAAGLSRLSAAGGVPVVLKNEGERRRFPTFLPDGRLLYLNAFGDPKKTGIFLAALDSAENRRLVADRSSPQYLAPVVGSRLGHLLFVRDDTLMAQPLDHKSLQPAGELFPVAEHVATGLNSGSYGMYSISETGVLVYQAGANTAQRQMVWVDRGGKELGAVGSPFRSGRDFSFSLSPDEKRVLISRASGPLISDLWMLDLERGTESRFTFDASSNGSPVWSPDGERTVFASNRNGPPNLYQKATNGTGKDELLLPHDRPQFPADWSRDGRFILFDSAGANTFFGIFALPLGGDRKPISLLESEFNQRDAQLSPDGRWLAYESNESSRYEVYVQPFSAGAASSSAKPAAGKWQISKEGGFGPRWRKDGKEMYYVSGGPSGVGRLMAVEVASDGPVFRAGTQQALFPLRNRGNEFGVSGDGKRFLMNRPAAEVSAVTPLTIVVNWLAGVRK